MWLKDAISPGEIDALAQSARRAWGEDTRYARFSGDPRASAGQCYVSSAWLVSRLGGHVGARSGHYAWLSPDRRYVIDLTGDHRGLTTYEENDGYKPVSLVPNERVRRFAKRADSVFDNLDRLLKVGLDYAGDAYPAEEPQAQSDHDQFDGYWHDEPDYAPISGQQYNFVYGNGQLEVSPFHSHDDLSSHAGIDPASHTGPFAAGTVVVNDGRATWEVNSNVNLHSLFRIFKDASKNYGWEWGGLTDIEGQPVSDEFAPSKKAQVLNYVYADEHLWIGSAPHAELALRYASAGEHVDGGLQAGIVRVTGSQRAEVYPVRTDALPSLYDWAVDNGLKLYAGNDNVYKTIPDLETGNNYSPDPVQDTNPFFAPRVDEREPSGMYRCPACDRLFPSWHLYQKHRREEERWGDDLPEEDGKFPEAPDMDDPLPAHFTPQQPAGVTGAVLPVSSYKEAARVDGFSEYAPLFGFDNDHYRHYVAYLNGSPVGYASVSPENHVQMVQSAVKRIGVARALLGKVRRHYAFVTTNTSYDWESAMLRKAGWVNVNGEKWKYSASDSPKDMIEAPLPFIYDVQEDTISVGRPGARTSDIPGRFTPGGIVEGTYEPGGKVYIRSMTSMPYTVRHLIALFYAEHPELEVKNVSLRDDEGKDTRLAATDIGSTIKAMVASDPAAYEASQTLQAAGGKVYAVGGAVRDAVMGNLPKDIDLMVTGLPSDNVKQALAALPGRLDYTGKDFGVFRYKHQGEDVEIALPRRERSTGVGHQDFDVQADHTMNAEDDLYRRDFTANAMAVDLASGKLVDPYGGAGDIGAKKLRTLSDQSLSEDPLRVVRALVARARHGLEPDESTRAQMGANAQGLQHLPPERIQAELDKIMGAKDPVAAIRLAHDTGVLKEILPEVDAAFGYDQNNPHHERELGEHLLSVLGHTVNQTDDPDLRLAALLHDIGKPASAWVDPETGSNHYYENRLPDGTVQGANHEEVGADMTRARMEALRYPGDRTNRVTDLVAHHMFPAFTSPRGARRFLNRVGPHADDLMTLRWADNGGKSEYKSDRALEVDAQRNLIDQVRNQGEATDLSSLAINGKDLIAAGFQPGPQMGQTLNYLLEQTIEDPSKNNPTDLLQLARGYDTLQGP